MSDGEQDIDIQPVINRVITATMITFSVDESISAMVRKELKSEAKELDKPKGYFYLTELCNLAQSYWSRTSHSVKKSAAIQRKLALGKQLHLDAARRFSNLPEFVLAEGKLDGIHVGIPGVRGDADYVLGDSLMEFKTKETLPSDVTEVIANYPHDIEQICFYSIIHPEHPKTNYLVFMKDSYPFEIKAFKIEIVDNGLIKSVLNDRISKLKWALEHKNPERLGKCRYCEYGCSYRDGGVCKCQEIVHLDWKSFEKSIKITFDEEFTNRLAECVDEKDLGKHAIFPADILTPRKHYVKAVANLGGDWVPDELLSEAKSMLTNATKKLPYYLNPTNYIKEEFKEKIKEPRLSLFFNWMKVPSSTKTEPELMPFIVKSSDVDDKEHTKKPSRYHASELAIICSAYGKGQGLVFIIYPKLDNLVKVFKLNFKRQEEILKITSETIDRIEKAESEKNILLLGVCPAFMNTEKKCPMTAECHKAQNSGCIKGYKP